jgi:FkbM family methyltransferase
MNNFRKFANPIIGSNGTESLIARRSILRELILGEVELNLIPEICDAETGFLDIGANEGVYACYAKRYCKHVYALEPNPDLASRLQSLLGARGTAMAIAASDHAGTEVLFIPVRDDRDVHTRSSLEANANPGFATRRIEVTLARVADLDLPPIGVIKIDVEGHEMKAVEGARPILIASHPILIIECEERHNRGGVAALMGYLKEIGYDCYFIHRGKLRPGGEFDIDALQRITDAKGLSSKRSPDYVNNFLFVDPSDPAQLTRIRAGLDRASSPTRWLSRLW